MPQQFPDNPSPEIAAERERCIYLLQLVARNPGLSSRASTALTNGYSLDECRARWGQEFQL
ncbi:MAG TPA: hypothetical protein VHP33_09125 [Polyangiaceae bacterium]|nr:hypothetical protein [Polyangiaceae bacterium]